ncbi:MAG TPA: hypothetical protein ENF57_01530 [Candidatus Korarchaeota archaeon]|nr:hypothetical protein [Candidatus Korarchaeota archaeon]
MRFKLVLFIALILLVLPLIYSQAQISYEINREKVILDVQSSGEILLRYNLTLTVISGRIARYVAVGMPSPSFSVYLAQEVFPDGKTVDVEFSEVREDSYYAVKLTPSEPIDPGESRTYVVEVELEDFIYEDETNPGNAGFMFTPSWFNARIHELEIFVILPPGVSKDEVKNQPDYDNVGTLPDGRLYLYWVRKDLPPNYKLELGVSFPKEYVERVVTPSEEGGILEFLIGLALLGALLVAIVAIVKLVKSWIEKLPYMAPEIFAESLGPNKNMAPAEVAYLKKLEGRKISYGRVLAALMATLVRKGFLAIRSLDPLRVEKLEGPTGVNLRIYERRFLECVKDDGSLDQDCLVKVVKLLHRRVEKEIAGYSRRDTMAYYDELVRSIWRRVREAPQEEKLDLVKDNLMWLLTDDNFEKNLKEALKARPREGRITVITYPVDDIWIWWPRDTWTTTLPRPVPVPSPRPAPSGTPSPRVDIPGVSDIERVADSIARSVEMVSSNIVRNVEGFADKVAKAIVPSRSRASGRRVRSISCACVSCACACACVSCACACAGGGVG